MAYLLSVSASKDLSRASLVGDQEFTLNESHLHVYGIRDRLREDTRASESYTKKGYIFCNTVNIPVALSYAESHG